ncbi:hypothetical protein, partial [Actinoplanes philippinensis]|uniref:hypothetical protein n=1 Tax=Actinoplanes philippinensis TaxID=35752 RepID=UPI0033DC21E9
GAVGGERPGTVGGADSRACHGGACGGSRVQGAASRQRDQRPVSPARHPDQQPASPARRRGTRISGR